MDAYGTGAYIGRAVTMPPKIKICFKRKKILIFTKKFLQVQNNARFYTPFFRGNDGGVGGSFSMGDGASLPISLVILRSSS